VFSRAFLNFNTAEAVYDFKAKFDGHVFVSTRGTQYRCTVEYAPFQKVPTVNTKKLAMEGTIQKGAKGQYIFHCRQTPRPATQSTTCCPVYCSQSIQHMLIAFQKQIWSSAI